MYIDIKNRTIQPCNITHDNYYRYINHIDKLATTGYKSFDMLVCYKDNIRFDSYTIKIMKTRYTDLTNKK